VQRTGEGREINRHNFTDGEINAAVQRPVVQRLLRLIRLRNEHPAFAGTFAVPESAERVLKMAWSNGPAACELTVDFPTAKAVVTRTGPSGGRVREKL